MADKQNTSYDVGSGIGAVAGLAIGLLQASQQRTLANLADNAYKFMSKSNLKDASAAAFALIKAKDKEAQVIGYKILATVSIANGDIDDANSRISTAIRIAESLDVSQKYPEEMAECYYVRGACALEMSQIAKSLNDLTNAIRLSPQNASYYQMRGRALRKLGDLDQALTNFNQAISLNPGNATMYCDRGIAKKEQGNLQAAFDDLNRAITLSATDSRAFRERGKLYCARNDYAHAIADYSEAIRLDPSDTESLNLRAEAARLSGNILISQVDQTSISDLEEAHRKYEQYVKISQEFVHTGYVTLFDREDIYKDSHWVRHSVHGFFGGVLFAIAVCVFWVLAFSTLVSIAAISLTFPFIGAIWEAVSSHNATAKIRQAAASMWYVLDAQDQETPRFSEFYVKYLNARANGKLGNLFEDAKSIFTQSDVDKSNQFLV